MLTRETLQTVGEQKAAEAQPSPGAEPEGQSPPGTEPQPDPSKEEGGEGAPPEPTPEETAAAEEAGRKKKEGGYQKVIRRQAEELEALRARNAELEGGTSPLRKETTTAAPPGDPRPVVTDFEDYEEYIVHLSQWGARQERAKEREVERVAEAKKQLQDVNEKWETSKKAVRARIPDLDEKLSRAVEMDQDGTVAKVLFTSGEEGVELAVWLGDHPDDARRIARLPSAEERAVALGEVKRELRLARDAAASEGNGARRQATGGLPAPARTVTGGGSAAGSTAARRLDNLPYDEYKRARRETAA